MLNLSLITNCKVKIRVKNVDSLRGYSKVLWKYFCYLYIKLNKD